MELRLEGMITADRHLDIDLPADATPGAVEVIVRPKVEPVDFGKRNRELFAWLEELHSDPSRRTRSREEIDAEIQAERDSWD